MKKNIFKKMILTSFISVSLSGTALAQTLDGFGNDIPLSFAIKQIVPQNYNIEYGNTVNLSKKVDWNGGRDWKDILSDLAQKENLMITFKGQTVSVNSIEKTQKGGKGFELVKTAGRTGNSVNIEPGQDNIVISDKVSSENHSPMYPTTPHTRSNIPSADELTMAYNDLRPYEQSNKNNGGMVNLQNPDMVVSSTQTWIISSNKKLSETFREWSKRTDWEIIWNTSYDYPIMADAKFEGDFVQAVTTLIGSMENAKPAIKASFFKGNKKVIITTSADSIE